jgi:hypothetical protein
VISLTLINCAGFTLFLNYDLGPWPRNDHTRSCSNYRKWIKETVELRRRAFHPSLLACRATA